jgi:hypothetical protein
MSLISTVAETVLHIDMKIAVERAKQSGDFLCTKGCIEAYSLVLEEICPGVSRAQLSKGRYAKYKCKAIANKLSLFKLTEAEFVKKLGAKYLDKTLGQVRQPQPRRNKRHQQQSVSKRSKRRTSNSFTSDSFDESEPDLDDVNYWINKKSDFADEIEEFQPEKATLLGRVRNFIGLPASY